MLRVEQNEREKQMREAMDEERQTEQDRLRELEKQRSAMHLIEADLAQERAEVDAISEAMGRKVEEVEAQLSRRTARAKREAAGSASGEQASVVDSAAGKVLVGGNVALGNTGADADAKRRPAEDVGAALRRVVEAKIQGLIDRCFTHEEGWWSYEVSFPPPLPACPVAGALATHARCCIATASPCHRHTCVGVGLRRSERDAVPPSDESRTLGWLTW